MQTPVFMPPTFSEGHIAFGLSVCVCVGGWVGVIVRLLLLNGAC